MEDKGGTEPQAESFNADEVLAQIKTERGDVPREETHQKLDALKSEVVAQKTGIYEAVQAIYQKTIINGEIDDYELESIIADCTEKHRLNADQVAEFRGAITNFQRQQKRIIEIKKESPSGRAVFTEAFGAEPLGDVQVEFSAVGIILKCLDKSDLSTACKKGSQNSAMDQENTIAAAINSGVTEKYEMLLIVAGPDADKTVIDHEIQHKFNMMYKSRRHAGAIKMMARGSKNNSESVERSIEAHGGNPEQVIREIIANEITSVRPYLTTLIKDELLAFYRQGMDANQIPGILRDSQYFDKFSESLVLKGAEEHLGTAIMELNKSRAEKITAADARTIATNEARDLMLKIATNLSRSFTTLEEKGFDKEKIIATLYTEAPEDWSATVRRIT